MQIMHVYAGVLHGSNEYLRAEVTNERAESSPDLMC
jgi:hypothetical protein